MKYLKITSIVLLACMVIGITFMGVRAQSPLPTPTPTMLPEDRAWFNAVPITVTPPVVTNRNPARAAASSLATGAWVPEVYDLNGLPKDWDWIHSHYGNTNYVTSGSYPQFILRRVDSTVGPATITVRVLDRNGFPLYNQPVALSWPGIDCSQPDPNIKTLVGSKTLLTTCGITQRTEASGYTGFGMSGDWYYRGGNAPGIIWILSPSTYSWGATGIGMLGGTNHEGPLSYTFQELVGEPATPTPVPPTITPTPGGPTPTPSPTNDLTETNDLLRGILDALNRLASHLGVPQ